MTNEQEQELRALYSQIPDDVLAVFEDYYDAQLEEALDVANAAAQASALGAADPNVVEADLVEELIFRTDGRDNAQGSALYRRRVVSISLFPRNTIHSRLRLQMRT